MRNILLSLAILLVAGELYAQMLSPQAAHTPQEPGFSQEFIQELQIKAIRVSAFRLTSSGRHLETGSGEFYEFDEDGHRLRYVKIMKGDTVQIERESYTAKGLKKWSVTNDRKWEKRYKLGYRFNQDRSIFQVKSYEYISDEQELLLDTRQYYYHADGREKLIKFIEGGKVTKTQSFLYDKDDRLIAEFLNEVDGREIQQVIYKYDSLGRIVTISQAGLFASEYHYVYNPQNQVTEIQWFENGSPKGQIFYKYKPKGQIELVEQVLADAPRENMAFVYEYVFRGGEEAETAVDTSVETEAN